MKLKPMADNILLKSADATETTASGIILVNTTREKSSIYEVAAVGPDCHSVTVGDRVIVSKHVGTDVTLDKVDYKFVKQEDLLAIVTD